MGDYSPAQIKNGATAVPFDITLQNCIRVRNIETKLKSNKVGSVSKELLANTLTGNDAAKGVGVLIEGLKNTKSAQMVLKQMMQRLFIKIMKQKMTLLGGFSRIMATVGPLNLFISRLH